jgi:CheY-like chemotaxis protein
MRWTILATEAAGYRRQIIALRQFLLQQHCTALEIRAGNAHLRTSAFPPASALQGQFVIVSLSDTGTGMPPEIASQAFEPFFTNRKDTGQVGLAFSDVSMPGRMDGIGMAIALAAHHPGLPVVLTSGYPIAPERLEHAGAVFLAKPCTGSQLRSAILQSMKRAVS